MSESLVPTAGQTVGPFFHLGLPYNGDRILVDADAPGAITLRGVVLDGAGEPVPDALLEIWQADADGRIPTGAGSLRRDGGFTGFGRAATDSSGHYSFTTLEPGAVGEGLPFFAVTVFARGLLDRLFTRAYLPLVAGACDPLLASVPEHRRSTLVCTADPDGYVFDIRLQGDDETVFVSHPRSLWPG